MKTEFIFNPFPLFVSSGSRFRLLFNSFCRHETLTENYKATPKTRFGWTSIAASLETVSLAAGLLYVSINLRIFLRRHPFIYIKIVDSKKYMSTKYQLVAFQCNAMHFSCICLLISQFSISLSYTP